MVPFQNVVRLWKDKNYFSEFASMPWKRKLPQVFLVIFLTLILAACSTGSNAPKAVMTPTAAIKPTPTTLAPGTLLYQSDWSHGLAGWQVSDGWKNTHGVLESNSSSGNIITSPYIPTVPNYAIEVHFQIMSIPKSGGNVAVTADKAPGKDGYTAGILNLLAPGPRSQFSNPEVQVYLNPTTDAENNPPVSDYEPGSGAHTFRIEVQGPQVQFFIDGLRKSVAISSQTDSLSNGPIHLKVALAIVRVYSIRLTAL